MGPTSLAFQTKILSGLFGAETVGSLVLLVLSTIIRGGNQMGRVGSGRFDFLEEIGSDLVRSIYMLYFFQILNRF
jgi:hypothetical protein